MLEGEQRLLHTSAGARNHPCPLAREDLGRLIADALPCEPERVTPLAQLVTDSTWQDREGEQSN
jgi:hypothetical protein